MLKETLLKNNHWKWLILALIAAISVYVTYPPKEKVRLGLDLAGGTSFTLGVDTDKLAESIIAADPAITNTENGVQMAIDRRLQDCDSRIVSVIRKRVDAMGQNEPVIQSLPKDHRLLVQLPGADAKARDLAKARLQSAAYLEFRLTDARDHELVQKLLEKDVAPEGYEKYGEGYVRAANWQEVARTPGYEARLANWQTTRASRFMLERRYSKDDPRSGGRDVYVPHFVMPKAEISGDDFEYASWEKNPASAYYKVNFRLSSDGGKKFSALTRKYKPNGSKNPSAQGRALAIVLDGMLISAPTIQSEIGSSGEITGSFSREEARQLAEDLNAGALPAPLKILAESTVSPTVGVDAIRSGIWAACIGFSLVAIFMFFYYWYAGLVADIALFLDIALLPTALVIVANLLGGLANDPSMGGGGSLQLPVLTMPGIAGLVLTLGMAVDANVLIFERIREEFQKSGATAGTAVANGYGRAFTAIFDSNLTTIITGVILFVVGTGPVRGFAITLTAGVVLSMFTALVVTRLVFDHFVKPDSTVPFKMRRFFKQPSYDFLKLGKWTCIGSAALIALSLVIFAVRFAVNRASVLAVDLTGGTSIVYNIGDSAKAPEISEIRKTLAEFDNAAIIQYQSGVGATTLLVKTGESAETKKGSALENRDVGAYITGLLTSKFPDAGFAAASVEEVGSVVGADLKQSGTKAVLFSLVAILIYVGFRFKFGFGVGGIAALAHDALISLGLFSLCGRQVSLIVITALLTIIGYSINDTVVVFDRIREVVRRDKKASFYDICNAAINSCLARTVITSVTTLFAVLALFLFGDGSIFDFALTMLIGIVAGTYSSIFIATPIMYWCYRGKRPEFEEEQKPAK